MNQLELCAVAYAYEIGGVVQPAPHRQTDFRVDGVGLGTMFGFEGSRPWFGQTCFETVPTRRVPALLALRGQGPAENHLGSGRVVLYRCHCGADECGVISCIVERAQGRVRWRDVRHEDPLGEEADPATSRLVAGFEFDAVALDEAIERHARWVQENDPCA